MQTRIMHIIYLIRRCTKEILNRSQSVSGKNKSDIENSISRLFIKKKKTQKITKKRSPHLTQLSFLNYTVSEFVLTEMQDSLVITIFFFLPSVSIQKSFFTC